MTLRSDSFRYLLILVLVEWANAQLPAPSSSSQTTHGTSWFGRAQIRNHSMRISIEAGYLDIVEDVEIGAAESFGRPKEPAGDRNTLEVKGVFHLPPGSAVTGILIWNGDQVLKGKLKPAGVADQEYEDFVDRNTAPPVLPRDPFYVRQVGSAEWHQAYEFKIYPVVWTEFRKVRVRYLVPRRLSASATGLFLPSPIFQGNLDMDRFSCRFESRTGFTRVEYQTGSGKVSLDLPATMERRYAFNEAAELRLEPLIPSHWLQTAIPDGEWKGHYFSFHAPVPREALEQNGLIRETIILWKWNHPEMFFERKPEGLMPTAWGKSVKDQALRIRQVAEIVWENEGEVGMVLHVGDRHRPRTFGRGRKDGAEAEKIDNLLKSIAEDAYWKDLESQIGKPNDSELNKPTVAQNGVIGFRLAIRAAWSLFSPEQNRLKTILLITVGPRLPGDVPIEEDFDLDYLEGVSLATLPHNSNRAEWPGVDLGGLLAGGRFQRHAPDPATGLPDFGIRKVRMRFAAGGEEFYRDQATPGFGLTATPQHLEFAGHAMTPWSPELILEMASSAGRLMVSTHAFQRVDSPHDTNLVKLWAKSPFRVSGRFPSTELGAIFGVVDSRNSLLALDHDLAPEESRPEISAGGIPHLQSGEIFLPSKSEASTRVIPAEEIGRVRFMFRDGWLLFRLPPFSRGTVRIASLSGRILAAERLQPGLESYRVKAPPEAGRSTLVVLLEVDGVTRKLILAGSVLR